MDIKKGKLKVGLKGKPPIIDDELCKDVRVDDSTWTLGEGCGGSVHATVMLIHQSADDQKDVVLSLEKMNQQTWWENVVKGAPKIDTTKIQPENSKLGDLDGETRAMVEKMMVGSFLPV